MEELKFVVGSRIYRLTDKSFRYVFPADVTAFVTAHGTEIFPYLLASYGMPAEFYDHTIWNNFYQALVIHNRVSNSQSQVFYKTGVDSQDDTAYTLQIWPDEQSHNGIKQTYATEYEAFYAARTQFLNLLGLEIEVRKSYLLIDPAQNLSTEQIKSIFNSLPTE